VERVIPGSWTWTDAWIFIGFFVAVRVIIVWFLTRLYIMMIPDGDRCPLCDGYTLPIERNGWWRVLGPRFRRSWCLDCQWEGVLRRSANFDPSMLKSPIPLRKAVRRR
jgi:hypothetical protein